MKKIDIKKLGGKGLYKAMFAICALVLCIITTVITSNNKKNETVSVVQSQFTADDDVIEPIETEIKSEEVVEAESYESDIDPFATENTNYDLSPDFSMPIDGEITKQFSINMPLYSETMDDWRIHTGIDIASDYGDEVYSADNGTVTEIGYDINYGYYVCISKGDYVCKYSSLDSDIPLVMKQNVLKGQAIGKVSDSAVSEFCDKPHLHFEILKNGEYINPEEFDLR